jgi:hypothetical protein
MRRARLFLRRRDLPLRRSSSFHLTREVLARNGRGARMRCSTIMPFGVEDERRTPPSGNRDGPAKAGEARPIAHAVR